MNDLKPIILNDNYFCKIVESSSRYFMESHNLKLYDKMEDPDSGLMGFANIASILQSIRLSDYTLCTDLAIRGLVYASYSKKISKELINCYRYMVEFLNSSLFRAEIYPIWIYLPLEISKKEYDIEGKNEHRGRISYEEQKKICKITEYTLESFKLPYYKLIGDREARLESMYELYQKTTWILKKGKSYNPGGYLLT